MPDRQIDFAAANTMAVFAINQGWIICPVCHDRMTDSADYVMMNGESDSEWHPAHSSCFPVPEMTAKERQTLNAGKPLGRQEQTSQKGLICSDPTCDAAAMAKGMCRKHYAREWHKAKQDATK